MCNLKQKTDLKTVTIYKVVSINKKGEFCSVFAGTPIKLGKVRSQRSYHHSQLYNYAHWYKPTSSLYNKRMVGKCSGFHDLEVARILSRCASLKRHILKIKLGGEIWVGDSKNISGDVPESAKIYAGTQILEYESMAHFQDGMFYPKIVVTSKSEPCYV